MLYALSPKTVDQVLNTAYALFPDSKAAKKKEEIEAAKEEKDEEMSTEAVAMAYIMRGGHFYSRLAARRTAARGTGAGRRPRPLKK